MFNKQDKRRNEYMLTGSFKKKGYDWWWHSFTAVDPDSSCTKPFYIEFFIINPKDGSKVVFGQTDEKNRPSYLMVNVGTWGIDHAQLHAFYPVSSAKIHKKAPIEIEVDGAYLSEYKTYGKVEVSKDDALEKKRMTDFGTIEWNLEIDKKIAFNVGYGASGLFRSLKAFEMFWHAEGMKTLYNGYVIYNGKKYVVTPDTSYGYADKNWGRDFTSPWVWLSSCNLRSKITGKSLNNSVFDIGGGRPKIGPIALSRKLLSAFFYEGKEYEFNFSKFWTNTKTKFSFTETDEEVFWHVEQKTWNNKMITDIKCQKSDMLFINYEAPNGLKKHNRLFNGGNGTGIVKIYHKGELVDEVECFNVGCEYGEYDK